MRRAQSLAIAAIVLTVVACSDSTGPLPKKTVPTGPENSVITPILLPPGAAWGLYFFSFNTDRNLTIDAIHYYNGASSGRGSFFVPGTAAGVLYVTNVVAQDLGCVPNGTGNPCDPNNNIGVPESAWAYGFAVLANRTTRPFKVDLHSNYWPDPTNPNAPFDTATLYFCDATYTNCGVVSNFVGELHHEPQ